MHCSRVGNKVVGQCVTTCWIPYSLVIYIYVYKSFSESGSHCFCDMEAKSESIPNNLRNPYIYEGLYVDMSESKEKLFHFSF